jgi:uncharacterized RDD family membrane protein YckC
VRLDRLALGPVHAAARSGRGILAGEAERAVDALFAGPLPDAIGRSLVEHQVMERVASGMLETALADRSDGHRRESSRATAEALTYSLVQSAAFKRAMREVLSSPEIRGALASQTVGFAGELGASARRRSRALDLRLQGLVGKLSQRRRPERSLGFGGLATRGVALVLDAALAQLGFVAAAASIALVLALAGGLGPGWLAAALAGAGWFLTAGIYFVAFWSGTGQTPGMRALGIRVVAQSGGPPSVLRSFVRFTGLILAIVPLFAGFVPVLFDDRRRAFHDFLSGTVVLDVAEAQAREGSLKETSSE